MRKTDSKKRKLLFLAAAILLFLMASASFMRSFAGFITVTEMLILQIVIILLFVLSFHRVLFNQITLIKRFLLFGSVLLVLWLSVNRATYFFTIKTGTIHIATHMYIPLLLVITALGWFILQTLKSLIFVQQSKSTLRNFRILLLMVVIRIAAVVIDSHANGVISSTFKQGFLDSMNSSDFMLNNDLMDLSSIFVVFVVSLAIMNGFRVKWIHYLNKRDKVLSLLMFFIFSVIAGRITYSAQEVMTLSIITGTFIHSVAVISLVYSLMAFMGILFLLPSAGIMDKRIKELRSFQELSAAISSIFKVDILYEKAVSLAAQISGADVTWIELKEQDALNILASYGLKIGKIKNASDSLDALHKELDEHNPVTVLINDCARDKLTKEFRRKWHKKECSLIAARLFHKDKCIGYIYGVKSQKYGFSEESRGLFEAFAYQIALAIENADLVKLTIEQQIYKEELRVAHEAQMRLLPRSKPLNSAADIDGFCITANEIGGDLYDFISVNEDRIDILVGDVSGKGASSAFYMAELKGVLIALAKYVSSPLEILTQANNFVRRYFKASMFATMVYCVFIPSKKIIRFARAGHPPVMLIRNGKVSHLETAGIGLGLAEENEFRGSMQEKEIKLKKGDTVFIYTDGVTEARDKNGEEFGENSLDDLLKECSGMDAKEALDKIKLVLMDFSSGVQRHDDITAVIVKCIS